MQMAELVERSGTPLARVKFYIREGMLAPGASLGARRAAYDDGHLERLRLIYSLTNVAGIPLAQAKQILRTIDHPDGPLSAMLGRAITALGSTRHALHDDTFPRATAAVDALGGIFGGCETRLAGMRQLEAALLAAEEAGIPVPKDLLRVYGENVAKIAAAEITQLPRDGRDAVPYAVLGTVLYEPVLAALRRLAHETLATVGEETASAE